MSTIFNFHEKTFLRTRVLRIDVLIYLRCGAMCFASGSIFGNKLNRFVLDKSHLRMRHDMWFSTFSGSLHSARSFCQVSMTVEDVFVQNNVC